MSSRCKKLRILLVEDTSAIQLAVKSMLESMGCSVSVACDYREFFKKFNLSFDGILTDVGMPDKDGFDVVSYIQKNHRENKALIYMYSAFGAEYIKERAGDLPVNGFFGKPFAYTDMELFVKKIGENKKFLSMNNALSHGMQ